MRKQKASSYSRGPIEGGFSLILATMLTMIALAFSYSAIVMGVSEIKKSNLGTSKVRARYAAQAGVELGVNELRELAKKASLDRPFASFDDWLTDEKGDPAVLRLFVDHELVYDGKKCGTINVQLSSAGAGDDYRDVTITVDAYIPNRYRWVNGKRVQHFDACGRIQRTVRVAFKSAEVFDYGYFIHNWGWFNSDSIVCNGNVRSNGQFDAGNCRPTVNGCPRYGGITVTGKLDKGDVSVDLTEYQDDNEDLVKDGSDGGLYSGWAIVGSDQVQGTAGNDANKHPFVEPARMPNLSDLKLYENLARTRSVGESVVPSSVRIGSTVVSDPVFGDDEGESGNLFLQGTEKNPIVVDGPVVVRGDLIISGKVSGQGCFYVGGNIYIPDNLEYENPPQAWMPASNTEADTEAWIAANYSRDLVGLFARENIVVGDFTDKDWKETVGPWLAHPQNGSKEDAGMDQLPNTRCGRDGIDNTSDDDVIDGDALWTVETFSQADADAGLIPEGFSVGDPIPGTGEDTDGDGRFDDSVTLEDFGMAAPLVPDRWGGNLPNQKNLLYGDLASSTLSRVEGVLFTSHTLAMSSRSSAVFNGAIVSCNDAMVYGSTFTINHDRRLLGGGAIPDVVLPRAFARIRDIGYVQTKLMKLLPGAEIKTVPPIDQREALDSVTGILTGKVMLQVVQ